MLNLFVESPCFLKTTLSLYFTSSQLHSFYSIIFSAFFNQSCLSHYISSHFISSYLISFYLISFYLFSSHFIWYSNPPFQLTIHNNTNQSHNAGSTNHLNPKDASPDDNANSQIGKQMSSFSGSFKNVVAYAGVAGIDGNLVSWEYIKLFLCRCCTKILDRKDDSMKFQWLITVNGTSSSFLIGV